MGLIKTVPRDGFSICYNLRAVTGGGAFFAGKEKMSGEGTLCQVKGKEWGNVCFFRRGGNISIVETKLGYIVGSK